MQTVNPQDFDQHNQASMDAQLLVRFLIKPRQDQAASREAGRPIFRDTEYVEIRTPGKRDPVCRPASAADKARFPKHYQMFKERTDGLVSEGTPLSEWPHISRSMVEELAFFNVKTVEHLLAMSDQHASRFMGINALKAKAKHWLEQANEDAKAAALEAELKKRDDEIAELRAAVDELKATKLKPSGTKKKTARKKATAKKE